MKQLGKEKNHFILINIYYVIHFHAVDNNQQRWTVKMSAISSKSQLCEDSVLFVKYLPGPLFQIYIYTAKRKWHQYSIFQLSAEAYSKKRISDYSVKRERVLLQ